MATVKKVKVSGRYPVAGGRHRLRWRLYLTDGRVLSRSRTFDRAGLADGYAERLALAAAGGIDRRTGRRWGWDGEEPTLEGAEDHPAGVTVLELATQWREATWAQASGNGRKVHAHMMRVALPALLDPDAPTPPGAALAWLHKVAFRGPTDTLTPVTFGAVDYTVDDLAEGRAFWERWSLRVGDLDRAKLRALVAAFGRGRAAETERRYFTAFRAVLTWGAEEGLVPDGLARGIRTRGGEAGTVEATGEVPTVAEMWELMWAMVCLGQDRWAALPAVMGSAGLRVGECAALRRRDCRDDPATGGMWLAVSANLATPGTDWTDAGTYAEERGTKGRRGGVRRRRLTFVPPDEAAVLRWHLATHVAPGGDARVFVGSRGGALSVGHLQRDVWAPARELAFPSPHRLASVGRHAFRHLAVTRWLRAGVPLTTAARWGGWTRTSTMVDFYDSALPGDDEFGAAAMCGR